MADLLTMATARRILLPIETVVDPPRGSRMVIASEDAAMVLEVPYAPREVEYAGVGRSWVEVRRPGLPSILSAMGLQLPVLNFELFLGDPDPQVDAEEAWTTLRLMAESKARFVLSYGPSEAGLWRFTSLASSSVHRHQTTNAITRMTAQVTFTRASDYAPATGPVNGGHNGGGGQGGGKTYKVKKGDTLVSISNKFFDSPRYWRDIADANKIKHPKKSRKLKEGRKLKIPKVLRSEIIEGGRGDAR